MLNILRNIIVVCCQTHREMKRVILGKSLPLNISFLETVTQVCSLLCKPADHIMRTQFRDSACIHTAHSGWWSKKKSWAQTYSNIIIVGIFFFFTFYFYKTTKPCKFTSKCPLQVLYFFENTYYLCHVT